MGLARIESSGDDATQAELTAAGAVMGTVDYMAPEQAMSTKNADARADIYSLGCTLFYLLTGKATYDGETLTAKLVAHQAHPIPELRKIRNDVSVELDAVFRKMIAKKLNERYQNMSEVIDALQSCASGTSTTTTMLPAPNASDLSELQTISLSQSPSQVTLKITPTKKTNASRQANRNWIMVSVGAACLGLAILAGIIISLQTKDGTLIVEVNQSDAIVQVMNLEGKIEISQRGVQDKISISVDPGKHRLKVEKDGFQFYTTDFELEPGGTKSIAAKLLPLESKPAVVATANPDRAKDAVPSGKAPSVLRNNSDTPEGNFTVEHLLTSPDYEWTDPELLGPEVNTLRSESFPHLTEDGKRLWFQRDRWVWFSERDSVDARWQSAKRVDNAFEWTGPMAAVFISRDELTWMFSTWSDPNKVRTVESIRPSRNAPWPSPSTISEAALPGQFSVMSDDGLSLYWMKNSINTGDDINLSTRPSRDAPWGAPVPAGATVSTRADERPVWISSDQRVLIFFAQFEPRTNSRQWDLFFATRPSLTEPWREPISFGPGINTEANEVSACLSEDGRELIFSRDNPGKSKLFVSRRVVKKQN